MSQHVIRGRNSLNGANIAALLEALSVQKPLVVCGARMAEVFRSRTGMDWPVFSPEDQMRFRVTFDRENLLQAHAEGKEYVRVVTRQRGDDGVYRLVETVDYFVTNPSTDDVLVIVMSQNLA